MPSKQLIPCPGCGELEGWREKRICKYELIYEADGSVFCSTDFEYVRGGKRKFCTACGKDITCWVQEAAGHEQ